MTWLWAGQKPMTYRWRNSQDCPQSRHSQDFQSIEMRTWTWQLDHLQHLQPASTCFVYKPGVYHVSTQILWADPADAMADWKTWLGKGRRQVWITGAGHREISSCSRAETSPECVRPLLYGEFSKNLDSRWAFGKWHRYRKTWLIQNDLPKTPQHPTCGQHLSKYTQHDIQHSQESSRSLGLLALHRVSATGPRWVQ